MPTLEEINKLASDLEGTCKTPEDFDHDLDDWTIEELLTLDNLVLLCSVCGWWSESGECSGDNDAICDECSEGEKDE